MNLFDFAQWKDRYLMNPGAGAGDGSMAFFDGLLAAVPEPATAVLLVFGLPLVLVRRRTCNSV